jgi:hypothetical protein
MKLKPKIKYINGVYQCRIGFSGEWIGFGKTPLQAYQHWYATNKAANKFNLAA